MHNHLPVTDNYPSWISKWGRMTKKSISRSISTKVMWLSWDWIWRPLDLQLDMLTTVLRPLHQVVEVLVLLFVALWFVLQGHLFCLALCYLVLVFFSPFSIATALLGEGRAGLGAFHAFFSVCACLVLSVSTSSVSGIGCGLWLWHSLDFSLTFFLFNVNWYLQTDGRYGQLVIR